MILLWDFNGTILDDIALCLEIENNMLKKRGLPPLTMEVYLKAFCFPVRDYYIKIGYDYANDPYESLAVEFIEAYQPASMQCGMRPGAREAFERLHAAGIRQGVLSASQKQNLISQLEALEIGHYFEVVLGLGDIYAASKTEAARQWMALEKINPADVLLLGDTVHDHEVAQALGASCALLLGGHQDEERLRGTGRPLFSDIASFTEWALVAANCAPLLLRANRICT